MSRSQQSESRSMRTTFEFARERATITELHSSVTYRGFEFAETIAPRPPILSLLFPLRAGDAWSGTWRDDTSGAYRVEVGGRDAINVGGRTVECMRLRSVTELRGEYEGITELTILVDPDTNMILRTQGRMELESSYGRYESDFTTTLRDGPGYR